MTRIAQPSAEPSTPPQAGRAPGEAEPVWTFRGYELHAGEFTSAMVHLFRAEINRANVWRTRLDSTTNWALVTTAAAVSFTFSEPTGNHLVLPLSALVITILLYIESRRYRYYELWSYRVRLMETDFFASMLVPPFGPSHDWAESLAEHLLHPRFNVSLWEALGRRLRRNYIWIFLVLVMAWLVKIWVHPSTAASVGDLSQRAAIGQVPGELTLIVVIGYFVFLLVFALLTSRLQAATGEVLPRFNAEGEAVIAGLGAGRSAWFRPSRRRSQVMCMIITDRARQVADRVLSEMKRGMTAIEGKGMYSGHSHDVLLSAITVTEVPHLKALVREEDPEAFVVVSPAQEILGKGFGPLHT